MRSSLTYRILTYVMFTLVVYFSIGVTLAVLPTYAHVHLGVSAFAAGVLISLQYIATFVSRPRAGVATDTLGPKRTVRSGLRACAGAGLLLFLGAIFTSTIWLSLACFALSRIAMGVGESYSGTGSTMWALGHVGTKNTARVISLNGVATYGGLAIGAPVGVMVEKYLGLPVLALMICALGTLASLTASRLPATNIMAGERFSVKKLLGKVAPFGLSLALGGLGFGMIATFVTLYFSEMRWEGAAVSLSIFGFFFVGTRLLLPNVILRFGGYKVTLVSLVVEIAGLIALAFGTTPGLAHLGAALIGLGFALVFPALAVEMVKTIPASMHGSAIGLYNAFVDLSLFLTGPVAGLIIEHFGYRINFLITAAAVGAGFIGVFRMNLAKRSEGQS